MERCTGYQSVSHQRTGIIEINILGLSLYDSDRTTDNFLVAVSNILADIHLVSIYYVSGVSNLHDESPRLLLEEYIAPYARPKSKAEAMLTQIGFPMDKVPERFQCFLTNELMDFPVIIPNAGGGRFDFKMIRHNILLQVSRGEPVTNPYNRTPFDLDDLQADEPLYFEIAAFVARACYIHKLKLNTKDYIDIILKTKSLHDVRDELVNSGVLPQRYGRLSILNCLGLYSKERFPKCTPSLYYTNPTQADYTMDLILRVPDRDTFNRISAFFNSANTRDRNRLCLGINVYRERCPGAVYTVYVFPH